MFSGAVRQRATVGTDDPVLLGGVVSDGPAVGSVPAQGEFQGAGHCVEYLAGIWFRGRLDDAAGPLTV